MAALQEATSFYGFKARWELDEKMTLLNIVSEFKVVDGMPDVKWNLKRNYLPDDRRHQLYLNIESECEISYMINLYQYAKPEKVSSRFKGTATGREEILLEDDAKKEFDFDFYAINGKLIISVDGKFSYTSKEPFSNNSVSASQWGLQLKECFPKDFDIIVNGNVIQIHKIFVAAESPVFSKMFEAAEKKVTITDAKFETVQAAMDYCYRQDISDFLQDLTNSINLLFFCDKHNFQTLKPLLETYLSSKFLTKENVSLLASTADQTNAFKLRQACLDFLCDLLKKGEGYSAEMIATLDAKFKDDLLFKAFN